MSVWDSLAGLGHNLLKAAVDRFQVHLPTEPIPVAWQPIVDQNVPLAARLDVAERDRLLHTAQLFLSEVPLEGSARLELTEEMRVTIAATACLLLLNLPYPRFSKLVRVLVYPDTFVPRRTWSRHTSIEEESDATLGQALINGIVVLSWESVLRASHRSADDQDQHNSHNVTLHEMAHILDAEDGLFDGTPMLEGTSTGKEWARVLAADFARQREAVDSGSQHRTGSTPTRRRTMRSSSRWRRRRSSACRHNCGVACRTCMRSCSGSTARIQKCALPLSRALWGDTVRRSDRPPTTNANVAD